MSKIKFCGKFVTSSIISQDCNLSNDINRMLRSFALFLLWKAVIVINNFWRIDKILVPMLLDTHNGINNVHSVVIRQIIGGKLMFLHPEQCL